MLHRAGMAAGTGPDRRSRAGARTANSQCRPASDGTGRSAGLRPLPRSAERGALGCARAGTPAAGPLACDPVAERRGGDRHRRHDRAALGTEDRGTRHLPRSSAVLARLLRQSQRPTLAVADVGAADPLGEAALGTAVPDRAGTFRTQQREARAPSQAADPLGDPGDPADKALAAGPGHHHRR